MTDELEAGGGDEDEVAVLRRTRAACAWLCSVAEAWGDESVADWLERLGRGCDARLKEATH